MMEQIDISDIVLEPTREDLSLQINTLQREVERLTTVKDNYLRYNQDLEQKIANVKGYIKDIVDSGSELSDEVTEIADLLDIELTKEICGTAVYEISWSAIVPLDFDADSMEISFDVECLSEVDDFGWNEDNCEVSGDDC